MRRIAIGFVLLGVLLLGLRVRAEVPPLPFTEGSVWSVTMVKTKAGFEEDYLKSLGQTWKKMLDEAKKQKLILSYKVLSGGSMGQNDWNLILMVEHKNMASLDGLDDKMRSVVLPMIGGEEGARKLSTQRLEIREIVGEKLMRELILK